MISLTSSLHQRPKSPLFLLRTGHDRTSGGESHRVRVRGVAVCSRLQVRCGVASTGAEPLECVECPGGWRHQCGRVGWSRAVKVWAPPTRQGFVLDVLRRATVGIRHSTTEHSCCLGGRSVTRNLPPLKRRSWISMKIFEGS